jgi:hypothetical protein
VSQLRQQRPQQANLGDNPGLQKMPEDSPARQMPGLRMGQQGNMPPGMANRPEGMALPQGIANKQMMPPTQMPGIPNAPQMMPPTFTPKPMPSIQPDPVAEQEELMRRRAALGMR